MVRLVIAIQHTYNPLHLYCRMLDRGFAPQRALWLSRFYEKLIYRSMLLPTTRLFDYLWGENTRKYLQL